MGKPVPDDFESGSSDNRKPKTCKAPVKSPQQFFYRPNATPVTNHVKVSEA